MPKQNEKLINLASLEVLIRGDRLPVDLSEEVFIVAYKSGLSGDKLMNLMFQIKDEVDEFDLHDHKMLELGYSMGQKDYLAVLEASENTVLDNPNATH